MADVHLGFKKKVTLKICSRASLWVFSEDASPVERDLSIFPTGVFSRVHEEMKTSMRHNTCQLPFLSLSVCLLLLSLPKHTLISQVSSYRQRFTDTRLSHTFVRQRRGSACARTPSGPIRTSQSPPGFVYQSSATRQHCFYLSMLLFIAPRFSSPDKCWLQPPPLSFGVLLQASNGNDGF